MGSNLNTNKKIKYASARDEFIEFYNTKIAHLPHLPAALADDADLTTDEARNAYHSVMRSIEITYSERTMFESLFEYLKTMKKAVKRGGQKGKGGRPRLPESKLTPQARYARKRRAKSK